MECRAQNDVQGLDLILSDREPLQGVRPENDVLRSALSQSTPAAPEGGIEGVK